MVRHGRGPYQGFGHRYDVVIVGARVAGAACALLLARQGARVVVFERAPLGTDTLSTHFVWPRGSRLLRVMGVADELLARGTPPIDRITFDPGVGADIIGRQVPAALCPRRTVLDRVLVEAALEAGAEIRHETAVDGLLEEDGRVSGVRLGSTSVRGDVVVGADGRLSDVARMAGADVLESHPPQTAGFYAYFDGLAVDGAEFHLRDGRLVYAWQTNDGLCCVYVAGRPEGFDALRRTVREAGLAQAAGIEASLSERLRTARQVSRLHGFAGQGPLRRRRRGPGWVLVGDAASFKDPTAGMGISEALEDAAWLASGGSDDERERDARRVFDLCRRSAALSPVDGRLAATYRAVAASEQWSQRWFGVLAGELEPREFFAAFTAAAAG